MATVVAPSTAVVVVTPPRPKPPRRVKDEAESERRIVVYQKQRAVYEEVGANGRAEAGDRPQIAARG